MTEEIELSLRDITEELKMLNKQLEVLNETLLTSVLGEFGGVAFFPEADKCRDKARTYLADRIK